MAGAVLQPAPTAREKPDGGSRVRAWAPSLIAGVAFLLIWEGAVDVLELPSFVLPSPSEIVAASFRDPQTLAHDAATTLMEALGGYLLGTLIGLALAIVFLSFPIVERIVLPIYVTVNSVPMVAYGPLAIIWLGVGSSSKVLLITIAVSFTVLINALAGLRSYDPGAIQLLRSFGASDQVIMRKMRIPAALPFICSGLRVAVVHSMILAVVIEMLGARAGLGWAVYKSTQMMSFVDAWLAVATTVVVSLAVYLIVTWTTRRFVWW